MKRKMEGRAKRGLLPAYRAQEGAPRHSARIEQLYLARIERVGATPRERLAWVVRVVQRPQKQLTPGDWENLRLELAAFTVHAQHPLKLDVPLPSTGEVREVLTRLGGIIEAGVKREPITLGTFGGGVRCLLWDLKSSSWEEDWSRRTPLGWADAVALELGELLKTAGSLLKECPAPAVRGAEGETCGEWFVAKRPNQDYCSATCQSRASTRAKRAGTPTPAALRRRQAEREG